MRLEKILFSGAAVLACSFFLCACAETDQEKTEITLLHGWGTMEPDHVIMRRIYEDFENDNPDVRLNLLSMPSSAEVIGKANDMLSVGKVPDLIFTGGQGRDSVYRFMVQRGYALDFTPYLSEDADFAEDISPLILQYWENGDGSLYTVSDVLLYSGGYWYNEDILKEAGISSIPTTWDEFKQVCYRIDAWAEMEKEDIVPVQLCGENALYLTDLLLLNAGALSRRGVLEHDIAVVQDEFSVVLKELSEINSFAATARSDIGYRDVLKQFNDGGAAMYLNGVWAGAMIEQELNVRYAPLPSPDGTQVTCMSACLGYIAGSSGDKDKMDASIRFVKYMVSDRVQERILRETGQVPSNPHVNIKAFETLPRLSQSVDTVTGADLHIEVPDNIWDNDRSTVFQEKIMQVLNYELPMQTLMDLLR